MSHFYDNFPEAVIAIKNLSVIYMNRLAKELLCLGTAPVTPVENITQLIHNDFSQSFINFVESLDKTPQTIMVKPGLCEEDSEKWIEIKAAKQSNGDITLVLSCCNKAKQELLKAKYRYRNLLNNLPDAIIINHKEKILFINKKGVEFVGLVSHLQIIDNHKVTDFFKPYDKQTSIPEMNDFLMGTKSDVTTKKLLFKRINGNKFPVEVTMKKVDFENIESTQLVIKDISLRVKAINRLKDTESRLQLLIDSSPDIICFKDGNGKWLLANKAFIDLLELHNIYYYGKTDAELIKHKPFYKDFLLTGMSTDETAWEKGIAIHIDETIETKNSGMKIFDIYKIPLYNKDKTRKGMVVIGRNVTERRKQEEEIKLQKERAQKYLNIAQVIMLGLDKECNITLINKMGANILEYFNHKELIGKNWHELIYNDPKTVDEKNKTYSSIITGNKTLDDYSESYVITKSGKKRIIGWHNTLLFDDKKNITGVLSSGIDITEMRSAQKKLKEQQEQLELIVNKTPALLAYVDKNLKYLYVNKAYAGFYKSTPAGMKNKYAYDFINDKYYDTIKPYIERVLKGEEVVYENLRTNETGEKIYVKAAYIPHFNTKGKVDAFLAMIEDITELKSKELNLLKALEKAEVADKLKQAFLDNLSHEFRTPMNAITGFVQILKEELEDNEQASYYLDIVLSSSYKLLNMLDSIIELSKLKAGDLKLTPEHFNLNSFIAEIYNEYKKDAEMQNLLLDVQMALNDDDAAIIADPKKIKQVFVKLITNAFKFTEKGNVSIGYSIKGKYIEFFVKDTGKGIPEEQQESIFEHFRQVETSHKRHYGGAGIGLTVSKHLVEHMGGKIWVKSTEGKGSSFFFTVPYNKERNTPGNNLAITRYQEENKDFSLFNGKTVLLTEDENDVIFYYKTLFKNSGINMLIAKSGKECLETVYKHINDIDIILMDIRIKDIDGIMLTKQIKTKYKNRIPVIIQTAFTDTNEKNDALSAGADDYITKPVNSDILFKKMKKLLL